MCAVDHYLDYNRPVLTDGVRLLDDLGSVYVYTDANIVTIQPIPNIVCKKVARAAAKNIELITFD